MLVLIGESGVGKTTIEDELIKRGYIRAISHTTREKREQDVEGVNYFFISVEEMEELDRQGELAERIDFCGNIYALCKEQCKTDRIVVVAPEGLNQLLAKDDLDIFSVYLCAPDEVRKERMLGRGDTIEKVEERLEYDRVTFAGVRDMVNITLDNSIKTLDEIVEEVITEYEKYNSKSE